MNNYDEKMQALKVLKEAIKTVDTAMDAIKGFAKENGIRLNRNVTLAELAGLVSEETGMKEECVFAILTNAFDIVRDLELSIVLTEDEDDDE